MYSVLIIISKSQGGVVVRWLAPSPHRKKARGLSPGLSLCWSCDRLATYAGCALPDPADPCDPIAGEQAQKMK